MSAINQFTTLHGCACGGSGSQVARRDVELITRVWEVDILHEQGVIHTNVIRFGQPATFRDGTRWGLK